MSAFHRLDPKLQHAIVNQLGWSSLRPVQEQACDALLDGKNAVVLAPTAGGKTEASMFPTLSQLISDPPRGLAALYIAPIKALLNNQAERLGEYTEMVGLDRFVWHGDVGSSARQRFLKAPASLLMTTPESIEVMLASKRVDAAALFSDLRVVVIDEVHALAGIDRGAHLMSVLERVAALSAHDVQRVGLSATVGNPGDILTWLQGTSKREGVIIDPPKKPARRELLVLHRESLEEIARDASQMARQQKSLFFCQSRAMTELVADQMQRRGTTVYVHHSAVSKEEREIAEAQFHTGSDACIVCTSTLELGIDVGDLDRVLQAEAPTTVSAFLQRMGRTGRRAGKAANTTFFCSSPTAVLQAASLIELARAGFVESVKMSDRCWPVLVHQLLAMALAEDGVLPRQAWAHLSKVPDLAGITQSEFERLVKWMVERRALDRVGGRLVIGAATEKAFGRRNFMEMYAVFSSPQTYMVTTTAKQPVGHLEQEFVDRLAEGASCFLLGGRPWRVSLIEHDNRRVEVVPASKGEQPSWSGHLPQFLGFEMCQHMLDLLGDERVPRWMHPSAVEVLQEERADLKARGVLPYTWPALEPAGDDKKPGVRWWTFAGGQINNTLRYAIHACAPDWQIVPGNLAVRIMGEGVDLNSVREVLGRITDAEFWEDEKLWREIADDLPNYRLSKFQPFMPLWVSQEMVASFLLDLEGTWRWLGGAQGDAPASKLKVVQAAVDAARAAAPSSPTTSPRDWSEVRARLDAEVELPAPPEAARPHNPIRWVETFAELEEMCAELGKAKVIGLDVETTMNRALCLIQVGTHQWSALVDPLLIDDLDPLKAIFEDASVIKVIHNATFEKGVLGGLGIGIENIYDTMKVSRQLRKIKGKGMNTLATVCKRELDLVIDKVPQTSNWRRRPLTPRQRDYAALDAEILLKLYDVFESEMLL
ncbi:MAG: DEAD/DEAH box helicase [Bradymonadia bacterium]